MFVIFHFGKQLFQLIRLEVSLDKSADRHRMHRALLRHFCIEKSAIHPRANFYVKAKTILRLDDRN